jgi:hypothetical protein
LFLPIVFSHAARIENLPFREFLSNPTKITQALRQMRGHLRSDGLTCYFDPHLEIEALGAELDAGAIENLASKGRIPVALEVIRRLKSMVRDDVLLTAGVSGPFRLASQLTRSGQGTTSGKDISGSSLELASEATAAVAKAFVEAGANVVIICEDLPVSVPSDVTVASLVGTMVNIVRFYQALPVLILNSWAQPPTPIFQGPLDCVVCPVSSESWLSMPEIMSESERATLGVAIPSSLILEGQPSVEKFAEEFRRRNPGFQPALITTSEDISDAADLRHLTKLWDLLVAQARQ